MYGEGNGSVKPKCVWNNCHQIKSERETNTLEVSAITAFA